MSNEVVLRFEKVSFSYDEIKPILKQVDFSIRNNSKITIMGQNGAGKSTIFKLITGELQPQEGAIHFRPGAKIGTALQMVPKDKLNLSVQEYFETAFSEVPFDVVKKINEVLDIVNLTVPLDKKVDDLSGGQQARLLLAFAIIQEPDLLLLDEPTNNLDKAGIEHLTMFLTYYPQTVIVISHDAEFLNSFTDGVLNLDVQSKKVEQFQGNYFDVLEQVEGHIEKQRLLNARMQKDIRNKFEKINKLGGKSVQLRKIANKMRTEAETAREQMVEVRKDDKTLAEFEIPAQHLIKPAIKISSVTFLPVRHNLKNNEAGGKDHLPEDRHSKPKTAEVHIELRRGHKLLIAGPNGIGKSTLLKSLIDKSAKGVEIDSDAKIGYYSQDFSELNYDQTVIDSLLELMDDKDIERAYKVASRFLVPSDVMNNKIGSLSEGQKGLLCYARFTLLEPGLLILDEPTNHINFRHIPAIADAIDNFKGAVILVSHYEDFLNQVEVSEILDLGKLSK